MLQLIFPEIEGWDETKEEFVLLAKEQKIIIEHSLVSISKWESRWGKPFLTKDVKTIEETIDYIKCMTITQNVRPELYDRIRNEHIELVNSYIEDSMTATWFRDDGDSNRNSEIITSEKIYYWMIMLNIPVKCEKWHLNRLLTLIRVINEENKPRTKTNTNELIQRRKAENEARKKQWNTKG